MQDVRVFSLKRKGTAIIESPRRGRRLSLAVGAFVTASLLIGGLAFTLLQPAGWSATATVMVLPAFGLEEGSVSSYYETLSRGQIVATYAEMLRLQRFEASALRHLEDAGVDREKLDVAVKVVPSTAIINLTVTASGREAAEAAADSLLEEATAYFDTLAQPFTIAVVGPAKESGRRTGPAKLPLAVVVALTAVVAGIVSQQVVAQLTAARAPGTDTIAQGGGRVAAAPPETRPSGPLDPVLEEFFGVAATERAHEEERATVAESGRRKR
jgi:capsular polysaccharide biosynthesis protein